MLDRLTANLLGPFTIRARSLERHLKGRTGHRRRPCPEDRIAKPPAPAVEPTVPRRGIVEARLLGTFELRVDGRVGESESGRDSVA